MEWSSPALWALQTQPRQTPTASGRSAPTGTGRLERIGLQLYTVRDLLERDMAGTLAKVTRIGYQEVEFAGYFGHRPSEVRRFLQSAGIQAPFAHAPLEEFRSGYPARSGLL
jgi:hypothetical protein